jgi:hypothetical protein
MELFEIQAPSYTYGNKSETEVARIVASHSEWQFDGFDALYFDGEKVAGSIEQAAAGMIALGWIEVTPSSRYPVWERMPQGGARRAEKLRIAIGA